MVNMSHEGGPGPRGDPDVLALLNSPMAVRAVRSSPQDADRVFGRFGDQRGSVARGPCRRFANDRLATLCGRCPPVTVTRVTGSRPQSGS